jgi:hypothetical protein
MPELSHFLDNIYIEDRRIFDTSAMNDSTLPKKTPCMQYVTFHDWTAYKHTPGIWKGWLADTTSVDLRIWGWMKAFTRQKDIRPAFFVQLYLTTTCFPLFVVFHPKNALRFLVYSLFLGTMAAPGYLDGWTGLGTVASLEQQQKHLVFLSFCL